ncbi:1,2-phenylacetyl-CoA epoxidase subunit PaaC [Pararhodobacter zhoushanensis]|uniref:Phenylacetate-CoA oxygenase subunit PaaC n=1 Tax=Pararhodobacter zhoushanensis TaxID=2479545 RepID=A0ABT3H3V0_9RHOB|nr:1,2-phenylacetyl-CoA epoxidase subunit PaaC [Pararhodobacter zhoushanensis]MCW1934464.1 phenylacetate-CoA oxygenase subunit PaaC [Pararhodobacter zhoushanensis]
MPSLPDVMTPDAAQLAQAAGGEGRAPLETGSPEHDLFTGLTRLGDTTLILGHRISEWCGLAPVLEEDIALANMALDLIGQTQLWLGLAGEVEGRGRDADALAFRRDGWDFHNLLLVERPNGDFGRTLMRQFLFDAYHLPLLKALEASSNARIAEIAAKAGKEVAYHVERSADLVIRLGDGTDESHARMQSSLDALWGYTGEAFLGDAVDARLAEAGVMPAPESLRAAWDQTVNAVLAEATLERPASEFAHKGGKQGRHSEHLGHLLTSMQWLQRSYPDATW